MFIVDYDDIKRVFLISFTFWSRHVDTQVCLTRPSNCFGWNMMFQIGAVCNGDSVFWRSILRVIIAWYCPFHATTLMRASSYTFILASSASMLTRLSYSRTSRTTCSTCTAGSTPPTRYHGPSRCTWAGTWPTRGSWPGACLTRVTCLGPRVMFNHCSAHDQEDERRYVTYYQWVGFTLFFQVSKPHSLPSSSDVWSHCFWLMQCS